jgi:hypothetical protein
MKMIPLDCGAAYVKKSTLDLYGERLIKKVCGYSDDMELIIVDDDQYDKIIENHSRINHLNEIDRDS